MNEDNEKDIKNYKKLILSLQKQLRQKDIIIRTLTEALDKTEGAEYVSTEHDSSMKSSNLEDTNIVNIVKPQLIRSESNLSQSLNNDISNYMNTVEHELFSNKTNPTSLLDPEDLNIVNSAKKELFSCSKINVDRTEYQICENDEIDFSKGFENYQPPSLLGQSGERKQKKVRFEDNNSQQKIKETQKNKKTELKTPEVSKASNEECHEQKFEYLLNEDKLTKGNTSEILHNVEKKPTSQNILIQPPRATIRTYNLNNNQIENKNVNLNLSSVYGDLFLASKQKNFFNKILTIFCNHNRNFIGKSQNQIDSVKLIKDMLNIKTPEINISYINTNKTGVYKYFLRNLSKLEFEEIISFYLLYSKRLEIFERRNLLTDFMLYSNNKDYYIFILMIVMGPISLSQQSTPIFKMLNCLLYNEIKEINITKVFKIEVPGRNFSLMSLINLIKDIHKPIMTKDALSYLIEIISNIENKDVKGSKYNEYLEEIRTCFVMISSYLGFEIIYKKVLQPFIIPGIKRSNRTPYYFIGNFLLIFNKNSEFKESEIFKELYGYMKEGLEDIKVKYICMNMLDMMGIYY